MAVGVIFHDSSQRIQQVESQDLDSAVENAK